MSDYRIRGANPITRAKVHPTSLKRAIAAKCFECVGGHEDGCVDPWWREEIYNCSVTTCPLWPHRPAQRPGAGEATRRESRDVACEAA